MCSGQLGYRTLARSHVPLPYTNHTTERFSHSHDVHGVWLIGTSSGEIVYKQ
ncbi:hypothetical protein GCM10010339_94460 [Streptomyces alanosinicus]|uniref:Uncharacterized protein n=1 Tax=Streptomyces alanosinicus TaxID=68171 RepID=A0A918IQX3_9ACTN|nr:hypothetical protein GCM10010339_94460 [Streptomyces alanosinicus]